MTRRFDQIVTNQISEQEILVESIPHLLHQDLAYLWILSLPAEQRPRVWRERMQLWKDLVSLFLSGQLELERISVERIPLGKLMSDVGLDSISWVRLKEPIGGRRSNPIVGVTSSTVIVRPLPTFDSTTASLIQAAARRRPDEASFFVHLALKTLVSLEGSTATTLTRILSDEFEVEPDTNANRTQAGVAVRLSMLKEIDWCNKSTFEEISFLTRSEGARAWVPRCSSCNRSLTTGADQQPIEVGETAQSVSVQCQSCSTRTSVALQKLLVWQRSESQIVIWKPDNERAPDRLPPEPSVDGIDVTWEWNAAVLAGEATRRFLRLRFPGRSSISVQDMDDIFYDTLLTCGEQSSFQGLPIRGEWFDALSISSVSSCRWHEGRVECSFDVAGYPERVLRKYGPGSMQQSDELVVGLYPDPKRVPQGWTKFRAFIEAGSAATRVDGSSAWTRMLPTVIETSQGLPNWFSVIEGTHGTTGVTFPLAELRATGGSRASIALDFGTTNTLVYSSIDQQVRPESSAIRFGDASGAARWFGKTDFKDRIVVGSFLPGPAYRAASPDKFNVPSAVWAKDKVRFIRWSPEPPSPAFYPIGGFKWDRREQNEDRSELRADFLTELLWIALPILATKMGRPLLKVDLGVSFPLAFDYEQKQRFERLVRTLQERALGTFGLEITNVYSLSESLACVRAFGTPGDREKFLIADMGGGTLDVALIRMDSDVSGKQIADVRQIGSLRLGGEEFIRILSRKRNPQSAEQEAWKILDALNHGDAAEEYGSDPVVARMLQRFIVSAFEFLRTMVRAYRSGSGDKDVVKFVLVGNGWHLVSAFSSDRRRKGDFRVWREFYDDLIRSLSDEGVELYVDEELKVSTKHLAAIGALKNVFVSQQRDHQKENEITRLPAGRTMRFGELELPWSTLVGDVVPTENQTVIRTGALTVGREPLAASDDWSARLTRAFAVSALSMLPMPSQEKLRERIGRSIGNNPPKIGIGPLQVIIEDDWLTSLENVD